MLKAKAFQWHRAVHFIILGTLAGGSALSGFAIMPGHLKDVSALEAGDSVSSNWLWTGTSVVSQRYGCTNVPQEDVAPAGWCTNSPYGTHWHHGIDIADNANQPHPSVGCTAPYNTLPSGAGSPLYAGGAGTVVQAGTTSYGTIVEWQRDVDSYYVVLYHTQAINVRVNDRVSAGMQIAQVGNNGWPTYSTGCHLHFEMRTPTGGYWNDIDPTPYLWNQRIGILQRYQGQPSYGEFMLLEGSLDSSWTDMYGPGVGTSAVIQIVASADLVGVVTQDGKFLVKQGVKTGSWITEYGPPNNPIVAAAALFGDISNPSNDRLGLITQGGEFFAKQGNLYSQWTDMYGPNDGTPQSAQIALSGDLVGTVTQDGYFKVKQGSSLSGGWITEYGPPNPTVAAAALFGDILNPANDRLGLITQSGEFFAKQGNLYSQWTDMYGPGVGTPQAVQISLSGDVVGMVTQDGYFKAKQGSSLIGGWYAGSYGPNPAVVSAAVFGDISNPANDRFGVITQSGEFLAKQGTNNWVDMWGPNSGLPPVKSSTLS